MWEKVFTCDGGVDFFYSDKPLEAMKFRDEQKDWVQQDNLNKSDQPIIQSFILSNKVMVFSKSYCKFSKAAKQLLTTKGVEYKAIELDLDPQGDKMQEELIETYGQTTVPYVFINSKLIGGDKELEAMEKDGSLDQLLFP